jgi:hypothetical protein
MNIRNRCIRGAFAAACMSIGAAPRIDAQGARVVTASTADVAIAEGRLDDAEQALFAASSQSAHEPSARGALGMFLASRGHLKVGAVLLEEARQFGGDASVIDARLARIYSWLGDWTSVAGLKHYAASGVEHDRAKWLSSHAPARSGPDSVTVPLEPNEAAGLGRIALVIGRETIQADIDPNVSGLVLPSTPTVTGESQQFGMHDSATVAAVHLVSIGGLRLTNVPARFFPAAKPLVGLDLLAALTPTFDAGAHRLTLHQHPVTPVGDLLPILLAFPGVKFVVRTRQPPVAIESAAGRAALRGTPWTLDVRRGAIVH